MDWAKWVEWGIEWARTFPGMVGLAIIGPCLAHGVWKGIRERGRGWQSLSG